MPPGEAPGGATQPAGQARRSSCRPSCALQRAECARSSHRRLLDQSINRQTPPARLADERGRVVGTPVDGQPLRRLLVGVTRLNLGMSALRRVAHLDPQFLRKDPKSEAEGRRLSGSAIWSDSCTWSQVWTSRISETVRVDEVGKRLETIRQAWARRGEQLLLDRVDVPVVNG